MNESGVLCYRMKVTCFGQVKINVTICLLPRGGYKNTAQWQFRDRYVVGRD